MKCFGKYTKDGAIIPRDIIFLTCQDLAVLQPTYIYINIWPTVVGNLSACQPSTAGRAIRLPINLDNKSFLRRKAKSRANCPTTASKRPTVCSAQDLMIGSCAPPASRTTPALLSFVYSFAPVLFMAYDCSGFCRARLHRTRYYGGMNTR